MSDEEKAYDIECYRKHKRPEGWGSLCPDDLEEEPQALLTSGVEVEGSMYNVCGNYALRANQHLPGRWHGFPIPWSRLPTAAKKGLIEAGRLDNMTFRKAIRKSWGREFDR